MKNFYDFDEITRVAMTESAIDQRRTLVERWEAINAAESGGWIPRAHIAATLLVGARSVADFGCGDMSLEKCLPPETIYHPVDVVRRDARTIVVDLNTTPPPELNVDACVCLGLLEYLFDVPGFLTAVWRSCEILVASYNTIDLGDPQLNRRSHAWVNDYDRIGLEVEFLRAGWKIKNAVICDGRQLLWRLRRS
jgi:hypothetical protein